MEEILPILVCADEVAQGGKAYALEVIGSTHESFEDLDERFVVDPLGNDGLVQILKAIHENLAAQQAENGHQN